jgi:hypothetical protein
VVGLPGFFSYLLMLACLLVDEIVGFSEVGEASLVAESLRDSLPKHFTTLHAVVTDVESNDLPGFAADHPPEQPLLFKPAYTMSTSIPAWCG